MSRLRFDNKVAIITGAGTGLGKAYAFELARRGCKVVVNDIAKTKNQTPTRKVADLVVEEIIAKGGEALANYDSVVFGDKIVNAAIQKWGRIDIVINNAGILRDKSFHKMSESEWDIIQKVHLKGTFMVTRAAWNHMRKQKYGRIINTCSTTGIYGNFGQANYGAAKLGIHGLTNTLAREGQSKGIYTNSIAPVAATGMTEGVFVKDILKAVSVEYIVPLIIFLAHESNPHNGCLFEVGGGWIAALRWQQSQGVGFDFPLTAEKIQERSKDIVDFASNPTIPTSPNDVIGLMYDNYSRNTQLSGNKTSSTNLKSIEIFDLIHTFLQREGTKAVNTCKAIYNFEITQKKKGPVIRTWGVDLKNGSGSVSVKPFSNPDSTFRMTDGDFFKVCSGTLNPQIAFLQGKMKIKGNMKKATLFTPELFPKPTPENFEKYRAAKL